MLHFLGSSRLGSDHPTFNCILVTVLQPTHGVDMRSVNEPHDMFRENKLVWVNPVAHIRIEPPNHDDE